jgi:hypothetical protein
MKRAYEILLVTGLFLAVFFIYRGQPRISLNEGRGWDGASYYEITEQIWKGKDQIQGELPYIKRIGTHFLVATYAQVSGENLLDSALAVNLFGVFCTAVLLVFWLRIFVDVFWIRFLLIGLFLTAWFVPLRFSFYYPMLTDAWGALWFVVGLLLLQTIQRACESGQSVLGYTLIFSIVVAIGSLFRESNAVLAIALFFVVNPVGGKEILLQPVTTMWKAFTDKFRSSYGGGRFLIFCLPLVLLLLANMIVSLYVHNTATDYSYPKAILVWFYEKSVPECILGACIAFGPLLVLLPFYYRQFLTFLKEQQHLMIILLVALVLGYISGQDTERIFFMSSFPIIFILTGKAANMIYNSPQRWWLFVLIFLQTIAYRLYWFLPDYPSQTTHAPVPFFGIMGSDFQYLCLYSHHGNRLINTVLLGEYIFLLVLTLYILHHRVVFPFLTGKTANSK